MNGGEQPPHRRLLVRRRRLEARGWRLETADGGLTPSPSYGGGWKREAGGWKRLTAASPPAPLPRNGNSGEERRATDAVGLGRPTYATTRDS